MTPERWQRIDALFGSCVRLTGEARDALLERECAQDPQLRRIVRGMLAADATALDSFQDVIGQCAAQVTQQPAEEWSGRELGAYCIERQLGAGGMGTVFLAHRSDATYERRVAIKVLSNAFASTDERRRFLSERQILADLAHPNIAQLLDGGTTSEGAPYLVMEYIDGVPIDEYCVKRQLPVERRLQLFLQVCDAVHYAHQHLVIHRDIKPGNILVTADGTPKLLDFGIAKLIDASAMPRTAAVTVVGARLMTPRHASPEQIRGEAVTTASDVYSLGVLLYRLLTDRYPYDEAGENTRAVEHAIPDRDPLRPSAALDRGRHAFWGVEARRRRRLSGELDNIVLMALRREPDRRYASAREFALDIECWLAYRPVVARADSPGYRLRKFVQRHSVAVVAGIVVTAVLAALVTFYTVRLTDERDRQVRERATAERVSQFMVDIFTVADPESGRSDVTARELLDQAYGGISDDLREQPLLAAKLMMAMGRAYAGLGMYDRSIELQREALALREQLLAGDDARVAESLHYVGSAQADRGDYADARRNLETALAIRERALGPDALPVSESLTRLAFIDMRESRYPAMREHLERSLAILTSQGMREERNIAEVYGMLGSYYLLVGDSPHSREAVSHALAIEEHATRPNGVRIAALMHRLGLLAWQLGEYPKAIELYRRELAQRERYLGPGHPSVGLALYGLGVSSSDMGNYREGLEYYRRALALQEKVFGPDSHYVAMTLGGIGFTLLRVEDYVASRAALTRALAIFEASVGPGHPDLRQPLAGLAKVSIAEHRYDEARARIERALTIVSAKFSAEHPDVLRTRVSLADVYRAQGDYAKALEYYEPSVAAFERTIGLNHPYAADALCGLASSLFHLGRLEEAEKYYAAARKNLTAQKFSDRRAPVAECLEGYADLLRKLGQETEAQEADTRASRIHAYIRAARRAIDSSSGAPQVTL